MADRLPANDPRYHRTESQFLKDMEQAAYRQAWDRAGTANLEQRIADLEKRVKELEER